jgi:hypothetical protein
MKMKHGYYVRVTEHFDLEEMVEDEFGEVTDSLDAGVECLCEDCYEDAHSRFPTSPFTYEFWENMEDDQSICSHCGEDVTQLR